MLKKPLFQNLLVAGVTILITLIIGEVIVRVARPSQLSSSTPSPLLLTDPLLGYSIAPNLSGHDKNGFKNTEVLDQYDIIALGDSHTYGGVPTVGQPDISWPHQLSGMLNTPVYNMGVWGYGPAQYTALMKKAFSFHPKVVVVGLLFGNDVFDSYDVVYHHDAWAPARTPGFIDDAPVTPSQAKQITIPFRGIRDFMREHSALYKLIGDGTRLLREKVGISKARDSGSHDWSSTDYDVSVIYDTKPELETRFWTGYRLVGLNLDDRRIQEGLRLTLAFIGEMQKEAKENGTKVVIALIPTKMSVYDPLVKEAGLTNRDFNKIVENESEMKQLITEYCAKGKIVCIDMLPYMQQQLEAGRVLYPKVWDEHPVAEGYKVYAEAIKKGLAEYHVYPR